MGVLFFLFFLDFRVCIKRMFSQFSEKKKAAPRELFFQIRFYFQILSKSLCLCGFCLARDRLIDQFIKIELIFLSISVPALTNREPWNNS